MIRNLVACAWISIWLWLFCGCRSKAMRVVGKMRGRSCKEHHKNFNLITCRLGHTSLISGVAMHAIYESPDLFRCRMSKMRICFCVQIFWWKNTSHHGAIKSVKSMNEWFRILALLAWNITVLWEYSIFWKYEGAPSNIYFTKGKQKYHHSLLLTQ